MSSTPALLPLRGHEELRAVLTRAVASGTLRQSILLHGPPGVGKERLGLWLARLIVCERPAAAAGPCAECTPCRLALRLEHPDIHWFFPLPRPEGAAGDRLRDKLQEARFEELQARRADPRHIPSFDRPPAHFLASIQTLVQMASVRPSTGSRSVFVVGDAELMVPQESSPEAANAFLKLLEEPPPSTVLILTSSQPGALLPTIRSRVMPLRVGPLPVAVLRDYLSEDLGVPREEAARIAARARGATGPAIRMAVAADADASPDALRRSARSWLLAALASSAVPRFAAANDQRPVSARGTFTAELEALGDWLRDLLAVASGAPESAPDPDDRDMLLRAVQRYGLHPLGVGSALDRVTHAIELASGNVNPQLILFDLLTGVNADLRPS